MPSRLLLAAPLLIAATAGTLGVRAAGYATGRPVATPATTRPVITVVPDAAPAAPAAATAAPAAHAAAQVRAADAHGTGIPDALPAYALPEGSADACESRAVPHPGGFSQMGGSGSDVVTDRGTTTSYAVYERHAPLQYVCTGGTAGGGVEVDAVLQPVGADEDTLVLDLSPAGVTLVSITPGRPAQGAQPLAVDRRLAAWPTSGCGSISLPGIDDTFCFRPNGTLRHVDLHERNSFGSLSRDISASLDDFPQG